jgi:hypothetical protein
MNEEAVQRMYELAQADGYGKSYDEFVNLMSSNEEAVGRMFDLAVGDGYQKDVASFQSLMGYGLKKKRRGTGRTFRICCGWGGNFCGLTVHIGRSTHRFGYSRS